MYKIFPFFVAAALLASTAASAQYFEIEENPFEATTEGTTPFNPDDFEKDYVLNFHTYVKNISTEPIIIQWRYLADESIDPEGWKIVGICDNDLCRAEDGDWYTDQATQISKEFGPDEDMLLDVHVYAPTTADDGVGTYKIELNYEDQTDTSIFILTKQTTGISLVPLKDNQIYLYPNPAADADDLFVYTDSKLDIGEVSVYNLTGQLVMNVSVAGKEVTHLAIGNLSSGLYIVKFADNDGRQIATRKFSRK